MAELVKEGIDLEAQSGVSRGSGEHRICSSLALAVWSDVLKHSRKEVRESEAYELSERRREDVNRPPTPEFEAENEVDSPPQQQILQDSKASSISGEYPALSLDDVSALTIDKGNSQPRGSIEDVTPAKGSYPRRMIGDFDDSANALWSLHEKEAKSHDDARIQSLKDDMDGVLIFVRCRALFDSTVLWY